MDPQETNDLIEDLIGVSQLSETEMTMDEELDDTAHTHAEEDDDRDFTYRDEDDDEHDPIKIMERQINQVQYWRSPLKGSKHKWMPSILEMDHQD